MGPRRSARATAIVLAAALLCALSGCGIAAPARPTTSAGKPAATALMKWNSAYVFLSAEKGDLEVFCAQATFGSDGSLSFDQDVPMHLYSFADRASWEPHIYYHQQTRYAGPAELCFANVPASVPYGPAVDDYLGRYGLSFYVPTAHPGTTPMEIAYPGQNSADPDIAYRDTPGLWALRIVLTGYPSCYDDRADTIRKPTTDARAATCLAGAAPVLRWFHYSG